MPDPEAEAAGDINAGQTHRLNRRAQGNGFQVRGSASDFSRPGRFERDNIAFHPSTAVTHPLPSSGASSAGKDPLTIAREMAAAFKSSGGSKAEHAKRKRSQMNDVPPAKMPASLPGPSIGLPRGARTASRKLPLGTGSGPHGLPAKAAKKSKGPAVNVKARPLAGRPIKLASDAEFLLSVPFAAGLAKSKHAPPPAPETAQHSPPRNTATPSLVSGSETPPSPMEPPQIQTPLETFQSADFASLGKSHHTDADADTSFANVLEDLVIGAADHDEEPVAEALVEKYLREGIGADNTVTGGPYFIAAIISCLPRIADVDLGT